MLPFQEVQSGFAAYIRDPDRNPMPRGIEQRRMRIYAQLFYNNIESFIAKTLPVFREITDDDSWHRLVRGFIREHRAESPYFSQICEEFMQYLDERMKRSAPSTDCPPIPAFALELCHYEWVEMALDLAPDADCEFDDEPVGPDDNLALSPLAWPLRYAYPVREIGIDCQPTAPPDTPTWLIGWRNREDRVRFMASNAVTIRLLKLIDEGSTTRDAFRVIAREIDASPQRVAETGMATLNGLHGHDIVVRR
ncbi:MAG: putative DNA-binding domain-containing protein [Gammaproteobacteria bacterium]|nr:putative DNA-binding domain-containing protein [Gammaproteobacteria bacterium]